MYEMVCGRLPFGTKKHEDESALLLSIAKKKVRFPSLLSEQARSLLRGLLTRNPKRRLGGGERDAREIKSHELFRGLRWDSLIAREVAPSFIPVFDSDIDTRYFEPRYGSMCPTLSSSWTPTSRGAEKPQFHDFSYWEN